MDGERLSNLLEEFEESDHRVGEPGYPVQVMVGVQMTSDETAGASEVNDGCTPYRRIRPRLRVEPGQSVCRRGVGDQLVDNLVERCGVEVPGTAEGGVERAGCQ